MLGTFDIKVDKVKNIAENYKSVYQDLTIDNLNILNISNRLYSNCWDDIKKRLLQVVEKRQEHVKGLKALEEALNNIIVSYENTERKIIGSPLLEDENAKKDEESSDKSDNNVVKDYLLEALCQILLGDFTDDSNLLGITVSVLLGFVPYAGQFCDLRDLVADIYNLFDDGPETSEWVALGFTVVAIIPGIGDFVKDAGKVRRLCNGADKLANGLGDIVNGIIKKADKVITPIADKMDEFSEFIDEKVWSKVADGVDDLFRNEIPSGAQIKDKIDNFMGKDFFDGKVQDVMNELGVEVSGFDDAKENWISNSIDYLLGKSDDNKTGGTTNASGKIVCAVQ